MQNYISFLRVVATFSVILLHVSASTVTNYNIENYYEWNVSNLVSSSVRFCVPIFLMISGATLLNKQQSISFFLTRRLKRILIPLAFWSAIYIFVNILKSDRNSNYNIYNEILQMIINGASYHFWYVYMITGIYLFIPILSRWIVSSRSNEQLYFIIIWFFTLFLTFQNQNFLSKIELRYFSGYIGYLVLGHYLSTLKIKNERRVRLMSIALVGLGILITYYCTHFLTVRNNKFDSKFYDYLSPNVVAISLGLFLLVRTIKIRCNSFCKKIDLFSYGIYLVHILILRQVTKSIHYDGDSLVLSTVIVFINSITIFVFSFLVIYLLYKVPIIKRVVT